MAYGDYNQCEIASCSLWYSDYSKFRTHRVNLWHSKGLHFVNDFLRADSNILSFEEAQLQYGITGVQFDYDCLVSSLPRTSRVVQKNKTLWTSD